MSIRPAALSPPLMPPEPSPLICRQPIVLLGGFLIGPASYGPMRERLAQLSGQPVTLVPVGKPEWLLTVFAERWARILDRVALEAASQAARSTTGAVTLIGHSSGGIMLRLFLDDQPFQGRRYNGRALANTLVMLGSPHTARRASRLRQLVAGRLPGARFAPEVRYVSVAGELDLNDPAAANTARRLGPGAYQSNCGDRQARGDGLVPVTSALLAGSEAVVLPGVAHAGAFGTHWYGSPEVVERWWRDLRG